MNKILIILFSLLISSNAYSLQKSDFEGKTFTYLQKTNSGDWEIENEYLKNGSMNRVLVNPNGEIKSGGEGDIWWVKNDSLYQQVNGGSPLAFSFDFNNNLVFFEGGGKLYEMTILKIDGVNVEDAKTVERKSLNNCSDISNNQIDPDVKGYKDVFFGMTKDEFRILAKCNKGSLFDIQNQGYIQDDSRNMGNNLIIFELNNDRYRYNVNAIFSGLGVTEISVRAYSEYHNVMRINSKSSGITGIDKIKDLLEKKYSLLIKPSDESIEKYNEYIGWNEVDFVFQNKDTQNLVILRVGYSLPDALGLKYSYDGNIHYLSKRASETYLNNIKSEVLSEDDF